MKLIKFFILVYDYKLYCFSKHICKVIANTRIWANCLKYWFIRLIHIIYQSYYYKWWFFNKEKFICFFMVNHNVSERGSFTIRQTYAGRCLRRSWSSGGWTPTRWSRAAGPLTASTVTLRSETLLPENHLNNIQALFNLIWKFIIWISQYI